MSDQPAGEKILPPSPRKIEQARERGSIARSQDLTSGVLLTTAILGFWLLGPVVFQRMVVMTQYYFSESHNLHVGAETTRQILIQALLFMFPIVFPIMLLLMAMGILINITQFGFIFSGQALQPKFKNLDPIRGAQRLLGLRALVELVKSLTKFAVIGFIVYLALRDRASELISMMHMSPWSASVATWDLLFSVWWRVALAVLAIGVFDFGFQRWQYMRDMRMTRQEAQDELKQLEGDPKLKQRVRQIQRQMAMQRMMSEVPEADVVVTNPTTYAVALRYDQKTMDSPTLVAKGARVMAERIRDMAVEHSVPIVERPEVARAMFQSVELGQGVPEHLFRAVAEILAYVYEIDRRESKRRERGLLNEQPRRSAQGA